MGYKQHIRIQFLASAVMEICWLFSWACLIMKLLSDRLFPYPQAVIVFSLAAVLTYTADKREARRIWKMLLHICGFTLASLLLLHAYIYPWLSFFSRTWLLELLSLPQTAIDWFILVLMVSWSLVFWVSGMKLAWRPISYSSVCRRFDFGILMFAGLLLFKLGLIHNGAPVTAQPTGWIAIAFLIFGLLATGLARNQQQARTTYLAGRRTVGILLSFIFLVLILAVSLTSLFWPFFVTTAEVGYDLLQQGFKPVGSILIWILRLFFRRNMKLSSSTESFHDTTVAGTIDPSDGTGGTDFLATVLWWVFGSLLVLTIVGLAGFALWRLIKWLLATTPGNKSNEQRSTDFMAWFSELPGILIFFWDWIRQCLRRNTNLKQIYAVLLRWGKHSGITHFPSETAREYGLRLGSCFPKAQADIALITELFQLETYAEQVLEIKQFKQADRAMQRLRHPSYWPARIHSRFRLTRLEQQY